MYKGFSALYRGRHAAYTDQPIERHWSEGVTPYILDGFEVYLWASPITSNILASVEPGHSIRCAGIVLLLLCLTLILNLTILAHAEAFHVHTGVADSSLFRAGWVFICACAITRYTGDRGGVTAFAVVVVLPLVYVRVSGSLTGCTAFFAVAFVVFTISRSVLEPSSSAVERLLWRDANDWEAPPGAVVAAHWTVFVVASAFHAVWAASHAHTLGLDALTPVQAYAVPAPSATSRASAALPKALFRTGLVLLCLLVREAPPSGARSSAYHLHTVRFLQALALCVTVSTLTAWTHCQHKRANSLRSVLAATVTAALCGILVETIQQIVVLSVLFPGAALLDAFYFTDRCAAAKPRNRKAAKNV
jgi:hypothetical protein